MATVIMTAKVMVILRRSPILTSLITNLVRTVLSPLSLSTRKRRGLGRALRAHPQVR